MIYVPKCIVKRVSAKKYIYLQLCVALLGKDARAKAGLTEKPMADPTYEFSFPDSEKISPPVLAFQKVSFSYSGKVEDHLYENLELGVDLDSRIALVGPNGAGKSTLLKLMLQQIEPTVGEAR